MQSPWFSVLIFTISSTCVLASPIISGLSLTVEAVQVDDGHLLSPEAVVDQRLEDLKYLSGETLFGEDTVTRNKGTKCILPDYSSNTGCPGTWDVQLSQDRWLCCSAGAELSSQDFSDITSALEDSVRGSVWPTKMVSKSEAKNLPDYEKMGFHDYLF